MPANLLRRSSRRRRKSLRRKSSRKRRKSSRRRRRSPRRSSRKSSRRRRRSPRRSPRRSSRKSSRRRRRSPRRSSRKSSRRRRKSPRRSSRKRFNVNHGFGKRLMSRRVRVRRRCQDARLAEDARRRAAKDFLHLAVVPGPRAGGWPPRRQRRGRQTASGPRCDQSRRKFGRFRRFLKLLERVWGESKKKVVPY